MQPVSIPGTDAVRYMSVPTGINAAHRTDSHGHCPQNRLTCANQQAEPCAPQAHPARANVRRGKAEEPLTGGGYHRVPGIPGFRTVIPAPVTTMIAAPGAPLLAAEARHDEAKTQGSEPSARLTSAMGVVRASCFGGWPEEGIAGARGRMPPFAVGRGPFGFSY
jgi:hypothetical protein